MPEAARTEVARPLPHEGRDAMARYLRALDAAQPGFASYLYLTGSVALDAFQPGRSDVGALVVTARPADVADLAASRRCTPVCPVGRTSTLTRGAGGGDRAVAYSGGVSEVIEARTFRTEDWYGDELLDQRYDGCEFVACDLTEAATRGCVFTDCTFREVRFNASRHTDSAFLRCTFTRCNLFETEFAGCKLVGSTFTDTAVRPMTVEGGDWSFASLAGADLRGVVVRGVRMREIDLAGANCADAVFADSDLSGAQLRGARFANCDLRGSDLTAFDPVAVDLAGALITAEQAVVIAQTLGLQIR